MIFEGDKILTNNRSFLWRSIHEVFQDFFSGLAWSIGDGKSVSFWDDIWLDDLKLREAAITSIPSELSDYKVADFLRADGQWNWDMLENLFDENVLLRLHCIMWRREEELRDMPRWRSSSSGIFSCKAAYNLLINRDGEDESNKVFKVLWKLKIPQRLKTFAWLAVHGRLLTNLERQRRHLIDSGYYARCNQADESVCHVIRDCPLSANLWRDLLPQDCCHKLFNLNSDNWFAESLCKSDDFFQVGNWHLKFVVTTSIIWEWRNKAIFQHDFVLPRDKCDNIRRRWDEIERGWLEDLNARSNVEKLEVWIGWKEPKTGWWKLNSDGSRNVETNSIAAGGVIRDGEGKWCSGFVHNIGKGSSFEAELWGVLSGLKLAIDLRINKLMVEADCMEVVNMINNECPMHHPSRILIRNIQRLLSKFEAVQIIHIHAKEIELQTAWREKRMTALWD
ncbi:hypothetical protein M5689_010768 [Euphorbia peplus]|nr:hypothetical protein M5689_010768 [Euphorbia peplus]